MPQESLVLQVQGVHELDNVLWERALLTALVVSGVLCTT
jgi:hypothetical protein